MLGGLTGVATAKGINAFIRNDGEGRWSNEYFLNLLQQSLIFYLLIAHHGRGKGLVNLGVEVNNWSTIVKSSIDEHKQELETAQAAGISEKSDEIIAKIKTRIFGELYNS